MLPVPIVGSGSRAGPLVPVWPTVQAVEVPTVALPDPVPDEVKNAIAAPARGQDCDHAECADEAL